VGEVTQAQRCQCCGEPFVPRPQNPTQSYCSQGACQRARKRHWQREKRASDPDYRANDQAARRTWARTHSQYWRAWRERHPEYVERNRRGQAARNARRRAGVIPGRCPARSPAAPLHHPAPERTLPARSRAPDLDRRLPLRAAPLRSR
jgi:hypothetical protein